MMEVVASSPIAEQLRRALRNVPASVAIITAGNGPEAFGITATAVTPVSLAPPTLLVCVYQGARLHRAIAQSRRFRVHYLRRDQEAVAVAFGGGVPSGERFEVGAWEFDDASGPRLQAALTDIVCRLASSFDCGTHTVFIGDVESVGANPGVPLLYCDGGYAALAN